MPLYEYRCQSCQHQFEVIQKFSDPPIGKCPSCGEGAVVKLFSSPAFQFKGSGWYITDSRPKSSSDSGESKAKSDSTDKAAEKNKDKAKDTKSEAASGTKPEPAKKSEKSTADVA